MQATLEVEVKREGFTDFDWFCLDAYRAGVHGAQRFCREESLLDCEAGEFPCPHEDAREHGAVEPASVGVAQGWVIRREQMQTVGEKILGSVGETIFGFAGDDSGVEQERQIAVEGDLAKADDDTSARQSLNLRGQMARAVANLLGKRLIAGRGATDDGGDPGMAEFETVITRDGLWFGGESEVMQDGIHEVAGSVAGEATAGAVGSVGTRREADDEDSGSGVAKSGNRASPINLVLVGAAPGLSDPSAVVAQTGAAFAGDDGFLNLLEEWRGLCACGCHCIP